MTNRKLAAMETRKKLVAAAKKIICDKGLVNTSIEEITEACGVSKGTFYTYFKRKEDIVFELSREVFTEILEKPAQRNRIEYIITQPCTQRNVPSPPKFRYRPRYVWIIKILLKAESEYPRQADCHITIS